jgi:hypothetical protein
MRAPWNTTAMPRAARRCGGHRSIVVPSKVTVPASAAS